MAQEINHVGHSFHTHHCRCSAINMSSVYSEHPWCHHNTRSYQACLVKSRGYPTQPHDPRPCRAAERCSVPRSIFHGVQKHMGYAKEGQYSESMRCFTPQCEFKKAGFHSELPYSSRPVFRHRSCHTHTFKDNPPRNGFEGTTNCQTCTRKTWRDVKMENWKLYGHSAQETNGSDSHVDKNFSYSRGLPDLGITTTLCGLEEVLSRIV